MRTAQDVLYDIEQVEKRLEGLRSELAALVANPTHQREGTEFENKISKGNFPDDRKWPLPIEDYRRYGRQMILPEIGLEGQLRLRSSSVLIVGLGGLGCPAAKYLAGAGVGNIGLLDGDTVELSNLHRQILHSTARVGVPKVHSAARSLAETNDDIKIETYPYHLTPQNSLELFSQYDVVLDCTDHPTSRYLISDAAVLSGRPLVSASALKTDGQLVVLNNPPRHVNQASSIGEDGGGTGNSGPCYRCIFPRPPPPETLVSCGEGGILGPVVGTMGVLQALEAIKVLTSSKIPGEEPTKPSMLIFSAYSSQQFRSLRMRPRRPDCAACGDSPSISRETMLSGNMDYVAFCGVTSPVNVLQDSSRLSATEVRRRLQMNEHGVPKMTVIDVRDKTQFDLANIPGSVNIPYSFFESGQIRGRRSRDELPTSGGITKRIPGDSSPLLFVCKFGNDSQLAAQRLVDLGYVEGERWIGDLKGGLQSWRSDVEPDFPEF